MIKLNDTNIFVGQIKQVLHTFNLPTCAIGEENKQPNKHYIKNNTIYLSSRDGDKICASYVYGKYYANLTSTLTLENNIYDRKTHRYLGKYLRFIKEYHKLDLMSMYNLFDSEELEKNIYVESGDDVISFKSDSDVICYQIPVKKEMYTLCIKSHLPINMTLTFGRALDPFKSQVDKLNIASYKSLKLNTPTTFDVSSIIDNLLKEDTDNTFKPVYNLYKDNIYLVISVPKTVRGPVVVLEGNYTKNYDNQSGIVYKDENTGELLYSNFYTNPKLLSEHNTNNYLLSDKLVEFLTMDAISRMSEYYDIQKVQKFFIKNGYIPFEYYGIWSEAESISLKKFCGDKKLYNNYDMVDAVDSVVETAMNQQSARNEMEGII